ncbi:hydroxymethylglutaryl-CoA synthase [Jeotgalibaca sp. A127]|uniref:hydroxymethylglutaryl-CoA synthase n=1 Tax=Jeotgalibaca sp. A127 TaxID=3457324 RepID=UPI003FD627A8
MNIGIDKIGFYAPPYYVDMVELANERGDDPGKYTVGIGQEQMAVTPLSQDIVSMAVNAALQVINDTDRNKIDLVIVGTESGFDASKSAAVYVHELLGIQPHARSFEIKQACYGATAGLQMAKDYVTLHPDRAALVIGSDVARYGLATGGEVTQGGGAIAMFITANPRILTLEADATFYSRDIMDFWRPSYSEYAMVDGQYSNEQYVAFFAEVWKAYKEKTGRTLSEFEALCFHLPYTKMGKKALSQVLTETDDEKQQALMNHYQASTVLNRNVGNIYTGSLYLSLLSLLTASEALEAGDRIGLFSYGSGAVGEFFSGTLVDGYLKNLPTTKIKELFANRKQISVSQYEDIFSKVLPQDGSELTIPAEEDASPVRLVAVKEHKRFYGIG